MPRDDNGNYTLPSGSNPVLTGTVIDASDFNDTVGDIAEALTDSLSRDGDGGMTVPFEFSDGTVSAPGITWTSEPTTGVYRAGAADMRIAVSAADVFRWKAAGVVQVYREAGWHSVIDAGTNQTFTGTTRFENNVTIDDGDLLISNNDKIRWHNALGTLWKNVLWVDDADVFTVGNPSYTNLIRGVTSFTDDISLTNSGGAAREALSYSGETVLLGNLDDSDVTIRALDSVTIDGGDLRVKESIVALDSVAGYQNFLSGVATDTWTVGDTDIALKVTGSSLAFEAAALFQEAVWAQSTIAPNNIFLTAADDAGTGTVDLIKANSDDNVVIGADGLVLTSGMAEFGAGLKIRIGNNEDIEWEDSAGGAWLDGIKINGSDNLIIGNETSSTVVYGSEFYRRTWDDTDNRVVGVAWDVDTSRQDQDITLEASDAQTIINMGEFTSNRTLTFPNNTSVAFPIGTVIQVFKEDSTYDLDPVGEAGVNLRYFSYPTVMYKYEIIRATKIGNNEWVLTSSIT